MGKDTVSQQPFPGWVKGSQGPKQERLSGDPITTIMVGGEMGHGVCRSPMLGTQDLPATGKGGPQHSWLGGFEDLDPRCSQLIHKLPEQQGCR